MAMSCSSLDALFWQNHDEMGINRFTLAFPGRLETAFRNDYADKSLRQMRIGFFLSILLYALFGLLDYLLVPDQVSTFWFIRFGIVCPVLTGVLMFSFSSRFRHYMQWCVAVSWITACLGILAMIILAPPPVSYSYYAGLILVFISGYTFVRARFVFASIIGLFIVVLYEITLLAVQSVPFDVFVNNNFFFISANILGMSACYLLELYARRDFYLETRLKQERAAIEALNAGLEARIQERTCEIELALAEKEVLLKEVHHRVKNNLQIITSLMRLQCKNADDSRTAAVLNECRQRIYTMAMIHENLYQSDNVAEIDFNAYVKRLSRHLFNVFDGSKRGIQLSVHTDDITLALTEAVPCALVLNELISNALQHSFTGSEITGKHLEVTVVKHDRMLEMIVADNGTEPSAASGDDVPETPGVKLVELLVIDQLNGSIETDRENGTRYTVRFVC